MKQFFWSLILFVTTPVMANVQWIPAGQLAQGNTLKTSDGQVVTVLSVHRTHGTNQMYNLTVNHNHDFFVSGHGNGVLVHNCSSTYGSEEEHAKLWVFERAYNITQRDFYSESNPPEPFDFDETKMPPIRFPEKNQGITQEQLNKALEDVDITIKHDNPTSRSNPYLRSGPFRRASLTDSDSDPDEIMMELERMRQEQFPEDMQHDKDDLELQRALEASLADMPSTSYGELRVNIGKQDEDLELQEAIRRSQQDS